MFKNLSSPCLNSRYREMCPWQSSKGRTLCPSGTHRSEQVTGLGKSLLKQPIFHFLVLGVMLFYVYSLVAPDKNAAGDRRLVIDESAVLEFVQYRKRAFNDEAAKAYLSGMDRQQYDQLVKELVREEALYQEALAMELDKDDYIIKRRLVQKMEYIARGFGLEEQSLDDKALDAFYSAHQPRYRKPATITFTHVFIDGSKPDAEQRAQQLRGQLLGDNVEFAGAMGFGDRFLYNTNYVERDKEYISSHFGDTFASVLFADDTRMNTWIGPLASRYGFHLVNIAERQQGGVAPLEEVRQQVYLDAADSMRKEVADKYIQSIIDSYKVQLPRPGSEDTAKNE